MKKLMLFGFALFVVVLAVNTESIDDKLLLGKKSKEHYDACSNEFGKPPYYITEGYENLKKEDEANIAAFLLCYFRKLGLMSENGNIIDDGVRSLYIQIYGDNARQKEIINNLLKKCKQINDKIGSQLAPKYKALVFERCTQMDSIKPDQIKYNLN
ncbi:uncharacterized protein LOC114335726 [Diabrotica virgifera virgifera]|uniref:Uncharacterized protein LOC114335726 n=1 Tax=Diabrotica virgifera virgifera TaxID=50390 RepID=A0A6P7G467_DIAVI|nr:uncharacterized protein LOC114335726 [Diabrotica virgifera virgifera]